MSEISKEVVDKAVYIKQKTTEGAGEKTIEELSLLKYHYDEMVNRINKLNEAVENKEIK